MTVHKVLFVCTGNICRSPTAEGVARDLARRLGVEQRFEFDSAGTHGYHIGDPPDPRTVAAARKRGYDLAHLRARRVTEFDFLRFHHVLAMGHDHLQWLRRACPPEQRDKLRLFLDFSRRFDGREVPDPYYGGPDGFEQVLDMVEDAASQLIAQLTAKA
ncbi:low molecular weight protein-tyrosine-phosphatase [Sulfuritalea sp.]|uniref:low molecular weight protein-tyrosine-phosphatase n=1 Tax=Sulfuritalea sp. TaxID=2480090 RepID=UPI001AC3D1F1|nr:low molecular weight protein-tyrosine-phosphatase [Sulfuritalea sp.]MBN8473821.1 low molecular weight phosphotyrosine protein phosphatase [Sulfuritalea sp.]